ncbi:glycoside hydrolase family 31 protein [uncultured Muribaculum sp.]|uniref:glycoside hydrolase family 31 protein n=1 Tax=uncultured Muribaculum sp. TaxID=1918613 RepID=UPI0025F0D9EE|nr:glycoside hydrolase family 31 protein [uncultured Muribaculum sp.]
MRHPLGLSVALATSVALQAAVATGNPVADAAAMVKCGNARFTVLTPEMIRIEYSDRGSFEDRATFAIVNRCLDVPRYKVREDAGFLYIDTDKLSLRYRKDTDPRVSPDNLGISMALNGDSVRWNVGMSDPLNLKGTCRTLDGSNGDNKRHEMEDGIISRSGWAVIDDSWSAVRPDGSRSFALVPGSSLGFDWHARRADDDALDLYFLGYGHDYKKALHDFTKVAGKIPMPPAYAFGYWYSKYDAYTSDDFRLIMSDLKANNIPADVMILDMDWHWNGDDNAGSKGIGGWTGWSWNTSLIPDPENLLEDIHDCNFRIGLNLHPCDGVNSFESPEYFKGMARDLGGKYMNISERDSTIEWAIDYTDFTSSFFGNIIRSHEKEGVDFWWLDWQQHLTSDYTESLGETFWCNHVFFNEMAANRPDRRPMIFHRWGGLGSHRYQIGFSGDACINFATLAFQPYFTVTASNVGYGYWGHDLGGHQYGGYELNDPELVLRWLQFGVFTPIFRTHATKDPRIERRIWKYSNFDDILETVRLRYSLFPYIYTMARKAYDTGVSICRPLYYDYPETEEAYKYCEDEYFFGDDILVAPVTEAAVDGVNEVSVWFPEGNWWSVSTNEIVTGPCVKTFRLGLAQIPYFFKQGSVIPYNPPTVMNVMDPVDRMILNVAVGADGNGSLYEDKKDNSDYASAYAVTSFAFKHGKRDYTLTINPRKGDADGIPRQRAYTVNFYNTTAPESVRVNGKRTDNFTFDPASGCTTVNVDIRSCGSKTVIKVK